MSGLRPMAGQIGHFNVCAPRKVSYAIDRHTRETTRLYGVPDRRLADRAFIAGEFSLADSACYPRGVPHEAQGQNLAGFPHLRRWFQTMAARPAAVRTYEGVENGYAPKQAISEEERNVLFKQGANGRA